MFKLLTLFICLASINFALATPEKNIQITVGEWPPFISESQKQNGFITHLIKDILIEAGYTPSFVFYPWSRAYKTAALGRANATAIWMYKAEREQDFYYSEPVLDEEFVFFHLKEASFDWSTLKDLGSYKLGGLLGSSYGKGFDDAIKQGVVSVDLAPTSQVIFLKLLAGRIDAFPLEKSVGLSSMRDLLTQEQQDKITFHPKNLLKNHSFLLVSKALEDSPKIINNFNNVLTQFRTNGRYQTYFDRFEAGDYELAQ